MERVKEELQQVLDEGNKIERLRERLAMAEALAERVTAAIGGEAVSSTKFRSPMENAADKAIALRAELAELEASHNRRKMFLSAVVNILPDERMKKVLRGIYFERKTKSELAKEMHYTWQTIYNIQKQAIEKLDDLFC